MGIKDTLRNLGIAGGGAAVAQQLASKIPSWAGEKALETAQNKIQQDTAYRDAVWPFVLVELEQEIDAKAARNLRRRQAKRQHNEPRNYGDRSPYTPLDEDIMIVVLGEVNETLMNNGQEHVRNRLFQALGRMSDKQFDETIEALHNDKVQQLVKKISFRGKEIVSVLQEYIPEISRQDVTDFLQEADKTVAGKLWNLDTWLDEKGIR